MAENDTVQLSLGRVLALGLGRYVTAAGEIAGETAIRIGMTADVRPPEAGRMLAEALGVPGPCTVTYDMADADTCSVLTAALEAFAEDQIPQQRELAALAGRMRAQALAARNGGHAMTGKFPPPAHPLAGSDSGRQSAGLPGHCEDCAVYGHLLTHPELGCADVGCDIDHG